MNTAGKESTLQSGDAQTLPQLYYFVLSVG